MILQLLQDTTFSANWFIAGILTILTFLLIRILNKIEKKQEDHEERLRDVEQDVGILKDRK